MMSVLHTVACHSANAVLKFIGELKASLRKGLLAGGRGFLRAGTETGLHIFEQCRAKAGLVVVFLRHHDEQVERQLLKHGLSDDHVVQNFVGHGDFPVCSGVMFECYARHSKRQSRCGAKAVRFAGKRKGAVA